MHPGLCHAQTSSLSVSVQQDFQKTSGSQSRPGSPHYHSNDNYYSVLNAHWCVTWCHGIKWSQKHKETTAGDPPEGGNEDRSGRQGEGKSVGRKERRRNLPRADGCWSGLGPCHMVAFYYLTSFLPTFKMRLSKKKSLGTPNSTWLDVNIF